MRDRHNIVGSEVGSSRPLIYGRPSVKIGGVPVRRGGWLKLILGLLVVGGLIAAAVVFAPSLM